MVRKGGHAAGAGIACGGKEKRAPVFASGEICAVSFKQFVDDFHDRAPFQLNWRLWVCTPRPRRSVSLLYMYLLNRPGGRRATIGCLYSQALDLLWGLAYLASPQAARENDARGPHSFPHTRLMPHC